MSRRGHLPKCSKTENENNIDCKVDLKIYPKDDFRKSLTTVKKHLIPVILQVGESNLHSFLSGNGRGVSRMFSGFQEGGVSREISGNQEGGVSREISGNQEGVRLVNPSQERYLFSRIFHW